MITLTQTDGTLIAISPMAVFCISEDEDRTAITSIGGTVVIVMEAMAEVQNRIAAWSKG